MDEALARGDRRRVVTSAARFGRVVARSDGGPVLLAQGLEMLHQIHRHGYGEIARTLAETMLGHGLDHPRVRCRYALILLDRGLIAAAEAVLLRLPSAFVRDDALTRAAIARVHHARYLGARRPADLAEAIRWYRSTYLAAPDANCHHGVRAAALLMLAATDGVRLDGYATPAAEAVSLAMTVRKSLELLENPDEWQLEVAGEARRICATAPHLS
ncbi:tetratricopeptide repeat-containing protein [Actinoplanes sp. NPDC051513]|uniref:tetratricopeptide repeat-containing protein n=1 Tax=Actinoplanes sp. NPDC051513 TaxID=3363908 RepID=UPI0037A0C389